LSGVPKLERNIRKDSINGLIHGYGYSVGQRQKFAIYRARNVCFDRE
jgi:hypothetical protein